MLHSKTNVEFLPTFIYFYAVKMTFVVTESSESSKPPAVLPVPVPIYVPTPMMTYNMPYPVPVFVPIPLPVPIFIPTTAKTTADIEKMMNVSFIATQL